jgi:hypothetical protein
MDHTRRVGRAVAVVLLLLATASAAMGQTVPSRAPSGRMLLNLNEHASAVQLTRIRRAAPVSRSLSGGARIAIGAGVGFALCAVPTYIGHVEREYALAAGTTCALMGAAVVYNLLR